MKLSEFKSIYPFSFEINDYTSSVFSSILSSKREDFIPCWHPIHSSRVFSSEEAFGLLTSEEMLLGAIMVWWLEQSWVWGVWLGCTNAYLSGNEHPEDKDEDCQESSYFGCQILSELTPVENLFKSGKVSRRYTLNLHTLSPCFVWKCLNAVRILILCL